MPVTLQLTAIPHGDTSAWDMPLKADLVALKNAVDTAEAALNGVVHLSGAETIAGVKTFSNSPVIPAAVSSNQAVNKAQLDLKADISAPAQRTAANAAPGEMLFMPTWDGVGAHPLRPSTRTDIYYTWRQPSPPIITTGYALPGDEWEPIPSV